MGICGVAPWNQLLHKMISNWRSLGTFGNNAASIWHKVTTVIALCNFMYNFHTCYFKKCNNYMDLFKWNQFTVQDANWVLQTVAIFAAPSRQQHCMFFQPICHTYQYFSVNKSCDRKICVWVLAFFEASCKWTLWGGFFISTNISFPFTCFNPVTAKPKHHKDYESFFFLSTSWMFTSLHNIKSKMCGKLLTAHSFVNS